MEILGYVFQDIPDKFWESISDKILGVQIPPQIMNLLKNVAKEFNK